MEESEVKLSRRSENKMKVIEVALDSFVEKGIEKSKVAEIAQKAGVTERSAFRYFATKSDLVVASCLMFWRKAKDLVKERFNLFEQKVKEEGREVKGIEEIEVIIREYTNLYFEYGNKLIFVHEAEAYLYRNKQSLLVNTKPIISLDVSRDPLAMAIRKGSEDKSVRNDVDLNALYFNTYDFLLGLIQKMALRKTETQECESFSKTRLNEFCSLVIETYRAK